MKIPGALLLLLLSVFALTAHAQNKHPAAGIPLRVFDGRPLVDRVYINGQGPFRFLLDTGSQTNHIDTRLAHRIGLTSTRDFILRTPSGQTTVHAGRASQVSLGTMQAADQEFLFLDFDGHIILPPDTLGILGQQFLSHFDYLLDLEHRRLSLDAVPANGQRVNFSLIYGRMALETNLGSLILDSGAAVLSLYHQVVGPATSRLIGASGQSTPVAVHAAPRLTIGDNAYHLDLAEYHAVPAAEEAGLLPAYAFRAFYVSNSGHYVLINPRP